MANVNLHAAKAAKNDEFYTQRSDIEKELRHYWPHFHGKTIYLSCDSERSEFWDYFSGGFDFFRLKKLVATHYSEEGAYKLVMENKDSYTKEYLSGNGDFRSDECVEILKEADIVVTNPPFSLFREFIDLLISNEKDFILVGNKNAITYKETFALIKDNKMWLGHNLVNNFILPEGEIGSAPALWFTTIDHHKRNATLPLGMSFSEDKYPTYDNYDAIDVSRVVDIPVDYRGVMGVPITFLTKYNPDQFEIVALGIVGSVDFSKDESMEILKNGIPTGKFTKNAKGTLYRKYDPERDTKPPAFRNTETGELYSSIYARILIKAK